MAAPTKFTLSIDLGSDLAKNVTMVISALGSVIKQLPNVIQMKGGSVKIKDADGNVIGKWGWE
jgi:hypothetical protein